MNTKRTIPLESGSTLDEFTIVSVLSTDSVSITYKATDQSSNNFIIKEFYPGDIVNRDSSGGLTITDDSFTDTYTASKRRFIELGNALSGIDSPILVAVLRVISLNNTAYIISNHEEAFSLSEIFKQTPVLDYEDIKNIIFPILQNLKKLHAKHVYHLSIKPENILIRKDGTPMLTGFGSFDMNIGSVNNYQYAPAEQFTLQENMIGPWSDIYALGAVLYQCISGNHPAQSLKRYESNKKTGRDNVKKAIDIGVGKYSSIILSAIDHALEIKPKDRPKSIDEWSMELLELAPADGMVQTVQIPDLDQTLKIHDLEEEKMQDDNEEQETREKLSRAYLGGKQQTYYMASFINQEARGYKPALSWNGSAFIFGIFWLLYRKMYLFAILFASVMVILSIYIIYPYLQNHLFYDKYLIIKPSIDVTVIFCISISAVFLGLFGNYFYYLHVDGKLRNVNKHYITTDSKRTLLSTQNSTSDIIPILAFLVISIGSYIGYQNYTTREKGADIQIKEAINALIYARNEVQKFRTENGRWPNDTEEVFGKYNKFNFQYIGSISVLKQLTVVTFKEQGDVLPDFSGKSLALIGMENISDKKIRWMCGSIDIPLEYLPADCKRNLK